MGDLPIRVIPLKLFKPIAQVATDLMDGHPDKRRGIHGFKAATGFGLGRAVFKKFAGEPAGRV